METGTQTNILYLTADDCYSVIYVRMSKNSIVILVALLSGVFLVLAVVGMSFYSLPHRELRRWDDEVSEKLLHSEPCHDCDINPQEWNQLMLQSQIALGNCFFSPAYIKNQDEFDRFADELDSRLSKDVALQDIVWLWDQFSIISTVGEAYCEKHRPELLRKKTNRDIGL